MSAIRHARVTTEVRAVVRFDDGEIVEVARTSVPVRLDHPLNDDDDTVAEQAAYEVALLGSATGEALTAALKVAGCR